jgi:hypothetical protein
MIKTCRVEQKGPQLWLQPTRYNGVGQLTHESGWFILDGTRQPAPESARAKLPRRKKLADKHTGQVTKGTRDPDAILIDDTLALYIRDKLIYISAGRRPISRWACLPRTAPIPRAPHTQP